MEKNLSNARFEVFSPKHKKIRFARRKYEEVIRPFFPCYVFARFDYTSDFRLVRYTRGVRGVVGGGNMPWEIGDELIGTIKSQTDSEGIVQIKFDASPGGEVRVIEGPFKGLQGIFERETSDSERVVVLLGAIEYQARVEIEKGHLSVR